MAKKKSKRKKKKYFTVTAKIILDGGTNSNKSGAWNRVHQLLGALQSIVDDVADFYIIEITKSNTLETEEISEIEG